MSKSPTLHLISHTHWDREWYLTFQQFRIRLVHMMDRLLEIFASDQDFRYFMLDGQTIVLEDYLEIRPKRRKQIQSLVKSGQLLIGPWYVLPDEFLVSPEAIVRNLLMGQRICRKFGRRMAVGYIPDPFGHIGQMPQILKGFGIEDACFWRGLADEPCEVWWSAPDGTRVLTAYLRESYSNAASLPINDVARFASEATRLGKTLEPYTQSGQLLLMQGTDHAEPQPETGRRIKQANNLIEKYQLRHSTLPGYFRAVRENLNKRKIKIPEVQGERRECKRTPLLPGVLSSRMWIKQRNWTCEGLLEHWAEPFNAWAARVSQPQPQYSDFLKEREAILHQAWRLLLQCHPHDSICGCSIDQVHEEMRSRFDQVEQIGNEITSQSLSLLATNIDTLPSKLEGEIIGAILVFNPIAGPRTDWVEVQVNVEEGSGTFEFVDGNGKIPSFQYQNASGQELMNTTLDRAGFQSSLSMVREGTVAGMFVKSMICQRIENRVDIDVTLTEAGPANLEVWNRGINTINNFLAEPTITIFHVYAHYPHLKLVRLLAEDIPGYGYRTYWIRRIAPLPPSAHELRLSTFTRAFLPLAGRIAKRVNIPHIISRASSFFHPVAPGWLENEFFKVIVEPWSNSISVLDKRSGITHTGLNRFIDGGDRGDEYNYCPPKNDQLFTAVIEQVRYHPDTFQNSLEINYKLNIPAHLSTDRQSRSRENKSIPITSWITLTRGVARIDFHTEIKNLAQDHRLRVHFPVPFTVAEAVYDGHFELVRRPLGVQESDASWVEKPRPEVPQLDFTFVEAKHGGAMIAARGLPEIEVAQNVSGCEFCLTLLRCVGWLSRDDLDTRPGLAGLELEAPGAQMPGLHTFDYAFIPYIGSVTAAIHQADSFNQPLRSLQEPIHPGKLPPTLAFLEAEGNFRLTAVKTSEDYQATIVRGYHFNSDGQIKIKLNLPYLRCEMAKLDEEPLHPIIPRSDGFIQLDARCAEIMTLRFQNPKSSTSPTISVD